MRTCIHLSEYQLSYYDAGTRWSEYYPLHIKQWLNHAKFWLETWKKPLHVIIYKDFTRDIQEDLVHMLDYFGFMVDSTNIERHCCVLSNPINKKIRRKHSAIDQYKEQLLQQNSQLTKLCDDAVNQVHVMLDKRWPGVYRIKRG